MRNLQTLSNKQLIDEFERAWKYWQGDELGIRRLERLEGEMTRREAAGWLTEDWKQGTSNSWFVFDPTARE